MKQVCRLLVKHLVRWARTYACDTFGDMAELHSGPCQRCVGHAVSENSVVQTGVTGDPLLSSECPARETAMRSQAQREGRVG